MSKHRGDRKDGTYLKNIADGYYYSKTVRLLRKLLENPELLEKPLNERVDY